MGNEDLLPHVFHSLADLGGLLVGRVAYGDEGYGFQAFGSMEEVLQIAPAGDRSMHKYENDSQVKKKDYTSGIHNVPYYEMAVKTTNGISLIKFEPDDKYLDAVCMKFPQKVIRK